MEINLLKEKQHNVNFYFLPTTKYKTITFILKLRQVLDRKSVTMRALLPFVLRKGTKNYSSEKQLMQKLDDLYGANLHVDTAKKGSYHLLHFQLDIANGKFLLAEQSLVDEALNLFYELIFEPNCSNDAFDEKTVQEEKRQLENKIKSIFDQKVAYANERLIDNMYKNERFSTHKDGYIEDLPEINGKNLYSYYKQMLKADAFDFYIIGDFIPEEMNEKITKIFKRKQKTVELPTVATEAENPALLPTPNKIIEKEAIQQAKLHIGFRTNCTFKDDAYPALQVFNGLFGAFPSSKLFVNVREKHSLAYYIASLVESHQGLLIVYSGVETANVDKTISIIEAEWEELKKGNFSDEQFEQTKDLIISNLLETLDYPVGTVELLYQQVVAEHELSPAQLMEQIRHVKRDEVIVVANALVLDTIYVLQEEVGEQNENN